MVLPLVKLGSLAFRTLSKPIAARLKHNAGIHPKFRRFIIGIAQMIDSSVQSDSSCSLIFLRTTIIASANHRFTTNMQRRLYGRATDVHIRPLNEEKAIQAAADLLGELFLFMVAGSAIIYEVQRNARSEARKEEVRRQEVEAIKKRGEELAIEVQVMKQRIIEMEQQFMKKRISEMEQQYAKWSLPGFRVFSFSTAQATPQPAGAETQQTTAA